MLELTISERDEGVTISAVGMSDTLWIEAIDTEAKTQAILMINTAQAKQIAGVLEDFLQEHPPIAEQVAEARGPVEALASE